MKYGKPDDLVLSIQFLTLQFDPSIESLSMLLSSVHKPCQGRIITFLSIKDSGQYATNSVVESALSRTIHAFRVVATTSSSSHETLADRSR